jgi:restriction system protein
MWLYEDTVESPHESDLTKGQCVFCEERMHTYTIRNDDSMGGAQHDVRVCQRCGWWSVWEEVNPLDWGESRLRRTDWGELEGRTVLGAAAELRTLDLCDLSIGIDEVRRYLLARYESRFTLHPRTFELTVASVFRSLGYEACATAYSADGGVDVILYGLHGETTGVQVKRQRRAIEVEQIRAFAGALMLGRHTQGVFVTTGIFQKGAKIAARQLRELSLPVELLDASRFFEVLKIAQSPAYRTYEEWLTARGEPRLVVVHSTLKRGRSW